MTKRFQTETLGSDFLYEDPISTDIVWKSHRCKSRVPPSRRYYHPPLAHSLATPHTKRDLFVFTVVLSAPQQFICRRSRNKKVFFVPHYGHFFHFGHVLSRPPSASFSILWRRFIFFLPTIQAGKILKERGPRSFLFHPFDISNSILFQLFPLLSFCTFANETYSVPLPNT
ncbi:hypothetical protein CEXT_463741 [Caerostris extrusa]|uniref:Uncharacterized protein n=1 Tax=Caerostris extrusa TaxID=172846 RepID=A0AAV4PMG4_CAEEX|nr:hypothetical protein CEXT_463741 [Caerostris extrusa]